MFTLIKKNKFFVLVCIFALLYVVYFSFLSIARHENFQSNYYDLGIMDQTIYNTSRGRILELTNPEGTENFKRMAIHNDLWLGLLAPFYLIYSGVETILIIQTIIVAAAALPLFLIAKKITGSQKAALFFSLIYLIYPPLQRANLYDFHAVTFFPFFFLLMVYFFLDQKYLFSLVFLFFSLITKEQVALLTSLFGFFEAIRKPNKRKSFFAILIFLLSIVWFFLSVFVIIPYFRKGRHFAFERYDYLVSGVLQPVDYLKYIFDIQLVNYLFQLFAPTAFLSLISPLYILMALPEFLINILSRHQAMKTIDYHYTAVLIPFIFLSAIYGFRKIGNYFKKAKRPLLFILLSVALFLSYYSGIMPYSQNKIYSKYLTKRSEAPQINLWKKILKDEKIVISATENLGPHFSKRIKIFRFSESYIFADYVLILTDNIYADWLGSEQSIKNYERLKNDQNFELIFKKGNFEVYKKKQAVAVNILFLS